MESNFQECAFLETGDEVPSGTENRQEGMLVEGRSLLDKAHWHANLSDESLPPSLSPTIPF